MLYKYVKELRENPRPLVPSVPKNGTHRCMVIKVSKHNMYLRKQMLAIKTHTDLRV